MEWTKKTRRLARLNSREGCVELERIKNAKDGEIVKLEALQIQDITPDIMEMLK